MAHFVDLIFLYGLPGSGKLTIAKELVRLLGDRYKLFHNQMTVDIISPIIPFPHPKGFELNLAYRLLMIDACAELDINLITTYVYAFVDEGDDEYIQQVINKVEQSGGQVMFVHLACDEDIIFQRIQNPDRRVHRKVSQPESLKRTMERWDIKSPIPYVDNLTIDTGRLDPVESARRIINYYSLLD